MKITIERADNGYILTHEKNKRVATSMRDILSELVDDFLFPEIYDGIDANQNFKKIDMAIDISFQSDEEASS